LREIAGLNAHEHGQQVELTPIFLAPTPNVIFQKIATLRLSPNDFPEAPLCD
jgi:hypothetical protein